MTTKPTILVADDDRAIRTVLERALTRQGYEVRLTGNARTLWSWVADGEGDLVITDVVMPDENGLDLVPRIREIRPEIKIIVMSAQSTLLTAVKANERGAYEYLPKPFDLGELISVVDRALQDPTDGGQIAPGKPDEQLPLIGRSAAMQNIYRVLARLMATDLTVLITGESGTGKELVARALHDYGKRRNGPFVAINMAAIPRDLVEAELFGHERGAFTGATGLYYRLNVVPINLPPLRERAEDIPELVEHFFARGVETGLPFKSLEPPAMELLLKHTWSGNVRELENLVQRLAALYADETITAETVSNELSEGVFDGPELGEENETMSEAIERHLNRSFFTTDESLPLNGLYTRVLHEMERPLIAMTLEATRGNQIKAAEILGLNRNTLRKKIRELDIEIVRGAR